MRVYRGDEFVKLPDGILYSERTSYIGFANGKNTIMYNSSQELLVKYENCIDNGVIFDWICLDLLNIQSEDSEDFVSKQDEMIASSHISYPVNQYTERDGLYKHNERYFQVWEKEDLEHLLDIIKKAIEASNQSVAKSEEKS